MAYWWLVYRESESEESASDSNAEENQEDNQSESSSSPMRVKRSFSDLSSRKKSHAAVSSDSDNLEEMSSPGKSNKKPDNKPAHKKPLSRKSSSNSSTMVSSPFLYLCLTFSHCQPCKSNFNVDEKHCFEGQLICGQFLLIVELFYVVYV